MTPTAISFTVLVAAASVGLVLWFRGNLAAVSARRMMGMMTRVGLDPESAALTETDMKAARRRCGRCPREDFCDRWLAGKVEGDNAFCVNARTFVALAQADAPSA